MTTLETVGTASQTLAQRMAKGRIPVSEALRYSMILAEALRKIHDAGQAHGAISPSSIALNRTGLDLLPGLGSMGSVTPYTAPEVVQGKPADSRSDIFSFGAILYEMLTGRAPFQGETPEALGAAIMSSAPPPSGSPAVDRVVGSCIAKDPAARWARMQKLLLELKLLAVAMRRSEHAAPARPEPDPVLRAELHEMDARLTGTLSQCAQSIEAVKERVALIEQLLQVTAERVGQVQKAVEITGQDTVVLRDAVARDVGMFETALKTQAAATESVRTAMAQTDDLVERVVEALESLQSVVLDHSDDRGAAQS